MGLRVFVTGTDTEVGKTVVAEALVRRCVGEGLRIAVMKPVASGCRTTRVGLRNADAERLIAASNVPARYETVNPYAFEAPVAPHLAARRAGVEIEMPRIRACFDELDAAGDGVVVEGVGGWRVPLAGDIDVADLVVSLELPVVLVVGVRLGCLNHALLTADAVRGAGAELFGWVANCIDPEMELASENIESLRARLPGPCLGAIPYLGDAAAITAAEAYLTRLRCE